MDISHQGEAVYNVNDIREREIINGSWDETAIAWGRGESAVLPVPSVSSDQGQQQQLGVKTWSENSGEQWSVQSRAGHALQSCC